MYHWGAYDSALYGHYRKPAEREAWVEALKTAILEAEREGRRVPPGLYAEYGYALLEEGKSKEAVTYFEKEKEKWPESTLLMQKMIRNAGQRPHPARGAPRPGRTGGGEEMIRRATGRLALAALLAVLAGCATAPPRKDLSALVAAKPRSILVVPVVNNSVDVTAGDYFLSTVPVPLAERGYYVFPVNLVKRLLEDDGLADASLVHGAQTDRLAALFGADAVLYIVVQKWESKWILDLHHRDGGHDVHAA